MSVKFNTLISIFTALRLTLEFEMIAANINEPQRFSLVSNWLQHAGSMISAVREMPTIGDLLLAGQYFLAQGKEAEAKQCEFLIRFLHNSYVSIQLRIGDRVNFAYGGIGIVIHKDAEIGSDVLIGQGVTIGGAPGVSRLDRATGTKVAVPKINDFVYISAGARVLGGIEIGSFSIVGANAVLKKSVPPFSVCMGVPVKSLKAIIPADFLKYKGMWEKTKHMPEEEYLQFMQDKYTQLIQPVDTTAKANVAQADTPSVQPSLLSITDICTSLQQPLVLAATLANSLDKISEDFAPLKIIETADNQQYVIGLPFTDYRIQITEDEGTDFFIEFKEEVATNTLFFYSLQWIGQLLSSFLQTKNESIFRLAKAALISYYSFIATTENLEKMMEIRSSDHACAIRIRVLLKFIKLAIQYDPNESLLKLQCLQDVLRISDWLIDNKNYRPSNHGLMGSISLMHVAVQFGNFPILAERFNEVAGTRITALVTQAFDQDGLCNENTIGYHRFNMSLYQAVINFARYYNTATHLINALQPIIDKADIALRTCIWQDGTIPPIGDSPQYETNLKSINKSFFFRESGLVIIKNDDLYVSLICGARSQIHKQNDNSSLSIFYKNRSYVVDSGHYSHNWNDPYRRALATQIGHSGVFLGQYDDFMYQDFAEKRQHIETCIQSFEENDEFTLVKCSYAINDSPYLMERELRVIWPDQILIHDSIRAKNLDVALPAEKAIQRFIFDSKITPSFSGDQITLRHDDGSMAKMRHFSTSEVENYRGESAPQARGWLSYQFGQLLPTHGVDFIQTTPAVSFITLIQLGESQHEQEPKALRFLKNEKIE